MLSISLRSTRVSRKPCAICHSGRAQQDRQMINRLLLAHVLPVEPDIVLEERMKLDSLFELFDSLLFVGVGCLRN